ncbi:MAG: glycosyltransferase [Nitrososphaeraceae archaeon]
MKDKISIIIPVYNGVKYLPKCIDSVLNQTYKNLEIILVDDGSTDESGKICDTYSLKDKRIKVIHKENGGVSDARNVGLKVATGKYIGFIDHDDFIESDMYEILLKTLYAYDADIVQCASYKIIDKKINPEHYSGTVEQFDVTSALEESIRVRSFSHSVWNKLYKKDLLQGIEFPLNMLNVDINFNYKVFIKAQKLVSIDIPKYYYLKRKDSVTGSLAYLNKMDVFYNYLEIMKSISRDFPSLFNITQERFVKTLLKIYKQLETNRYFDIDKKRRNLIQDYINKNHRSLVSNPLINGKTKFLLKLFKKNFGLVYYSLDLDYRFRKKIKRMLGNNEKIILILKKIFSSKYSIKKYDVKVIKENIDNSKPTVFTLLPPEQESYKNQSIALALEKILKVSLPDYNIVEIECKNTYKAIKILKKVVKSPDVFCLCGVGNEEDQYLSEELKKSFPKNKVILAPDIVLYLNEQDKAVTRKNVFACLNADIKSIIGYKEKIDLLLKLRKEYRDIAIGDRNISHKVSANTRETELKKILDTFRTSKVVITDRLNDMIFSAITGTPCIVLLNNDHKAYDAYKQLKDRSYIKLIEKFDMDEILKWVNHFYKYDTSKIIVPDFSAKFGELVAELSMNYRN